MSGSPSLHDPIFQPGDVLNNTYRIEAALGRGGTSEVYRARSEISGRVVALKALRSEFSRNEDYLSLMRREEDIREIRHDGIVRYFDNQRTDDGTVYLIMDYVEGPGLDVKLKSGGMSAEDLMIVAGRVSDALAAAHAKKIVHRDLSPDNIILRNGNPAEAVIIDFGIAKDSNPGAETIVGNEFAGKYAYAAPEQLAGKTDERADIYALGALLLATFRGKPPQVGNNPMEVVTRKSQPLDTSGVPEPLKSLIDQMTQPDPAKRLPNAATVLETIRRGHVPAASGDADRTVIVPRSTTQPSRTAPSAKPDTASKPVPAAPAKSGRSGLIAALVVAAAALGGGGAYLAGLFGPKYPVADPFVLVVERKADSPAQASGVVPSEDIQQALTGKMTDIGGAADLSIATGDIANSWGPDVLSLIDAVAQLPEWRVASSGNSVEVTGLTLNRDEQQRLMELPLPAALNGTVQIDLGPRFLTAAMLRPILIEMADCGELLLAPPSAAGYPVDSTVFVTGHVADSATQVALEDALRAVIGPRELRVETAVLNPTLCLFDAVLPTAPGGGFEIAFGYGDRPDANPGGTYVVGDNPVIDVVIPANVVDGYIYVSALDVSGNVFHLLPNLKRADNSVKALRDGRSGPVSVRVAYSIAEAKEKDGLAFVVDETALGKTRVMVLHSAQPIFDSLRPTTESAWGYAAALETLTSPVTSLDSSILTTQRP